MRTRHLSLLLSTIGLVSLLGTNALGQGADGNVSAGELAGFQQIYGINEIPTAANFANGVPYDLDASDTAFPTGVERIGVYYQLDDEWVWVSMDAYTENPKQMGIPEVNTNNFFFEQIVENMTVETNSDFVTPGSVDQGNIEIWPTNYATANAIGIPFADDATYDFGDQRVADASYGSFQFHNFDAEETIFAINRFNAGDGYDTTIGNLFGGANPDATFAQNSAEFDTRLLQIWAKPIGGLVGDLNQDGALDLADFNIFSANFNETGTTRVTGDLNSDTTTDLQDWIIFREAFNAPAGASTAAVPEPVALGLACLAMLGVLSTRRRRSC